MFLIDQPYVSEFLINTIKTCNYPIIATSACKALVSDTSLNWVSEDKAIALLKSNPEQALYSNSENALSWVETHLKDSDINKRILSVKDKATFRDKIKDLFPDFKFRKIKLQDLEDVSVEELTFPFVIKPSVGFLSLGVYVVTDEANWERVKKELLLQTFKGLFPKNVIDTSYFIMEDLAEGEEYAIDYYYDEKGNVIILGVLHHVFSSGTDTSDRVYTTSKAIIDQHKNALEKFLKDIGAPLGLKNFPAHAEVRIDKEGRILPIEINPMRFGGWCTTADLSGLVLGLNPYKCFIDKISPDWETLFQGKEGKLFSVIVLDNNSGIKASEIEKFDYQALADDFENPISIRPLDIQDYPLFGFVFVETDTKNKNELQKILSSNLKKYIVLKS